MARLQEALKCCHRTPYRAARVYGGEKPAIQMVDLAKGCDLLVATPGRLQDSGESSLGETRLMARHT